jgi:hypothetical protein
MPNGRAAPGNVVPEPLLPIEVSTYAVGSAGNAGCVAAPAAVAGEAVRRTAATSAAGTEMDTERTRLSDVGKVVPPQRRLSVPDSVVRSDQFVKGS